MDKDNISSFIKDGGDLVDFIFDRVIKRFITVCNSFEGVFTDSFDCSRASEKHFHDFVNGLSGDYRKIANRFSAKTHKPGV